MLRISLLITLLSGWFSLFVNSTKTPIPPQNNAVVHAVLFYSPSCAHCEYVIREALPPILREYGDRVHIIGVDASQFDGSMLFQAAIERFEMEGGPVPTLIVGDNVLIGSKDIPEKFPGLIEEYLAQGGVDWPDIPGLAEAFTAVQTAEVETAETSITETSPSPASSTQVPSMTNTPAPTLTPSNLVLTGETEGDNLWERISRDPVGNTLSILVLIGMVVSVIGAVLLFRRSPGSLLPFSWNLVIPILCILGISIAGYLAYVETTQIQAVCGPVGDCNTVQQSEYARLFGLIPIGDLGVVGYLMILIGWIIRRFAKEPMTTYANLAMLVLTASGTLFSIYLTFLEPFVIGATCAWCITQAVLMTSLLWLTVLPGKLAFSSMQKGSHLQTEKLSITTPDSASNTEDTHGDIHD